MIEEKFDAIVVGADRIASNGDTDAPYEQCWVMRSSGLPGLVGAGSASERCA